MIGLVMPARLRAALLAAATAAGLLVGVAAPADAADACGDARVKTDGSTWRCTFVDDFNGTSLNRTKWAVQQTAISGFRIGQTCFVDDDRQLQVRRGAAELTVSKSSRTFQCSPGFTTQYKGVDIGTWRRFSQTYGRFEARLKLPSATKAGYKGGFWMNPQEQAYGPWPGSGEVDIAEWWSSSPSYVYPSLHYGGSTNADTGRTCAIARADVYHVYAVEWDRAEMRFEVDGKVCFTRSWLPAPPLVAPQPFDQPFYMSLSAAADWVVDPSTTYPGKVTIDYVKAWA